MMLARLAWGIWAIVPVVAVTYHFGPGQAAYAIDRAARLQNQASASQVVAQQAQEIAYSAHLVAIDARRLAFLEPSVEHQAQALDATTSEERLYAHAADLWKESADRLQDVLTTLGDASPKTARDIRWARAHANVRAGEIWTGIEDLEALVNELEGLDGTDGEHKSPSASDAAFARSVREELATAYYYGARLLRLSGMPAQEWRVESGKARQHFRYLAESVDDEPAKNYQRNLELVLNLEQSNLMDLQGKPLPKESPRVGKNGDRPGNRPGKSKRPPQQDGRGAGGAEQIRDGW